MSDAVTTKSKAEQVAQKLLARIIETGLAPGSTCGTEAQLVEQFNVSRPTLRESLRILESQGVLELRPGPGGGILVRKPSTDILAHGLSVYLSLNQVPFLDVLKARELIEPALAAQAAANGTPHDFDEMDQSILRMSGIDKQDEFLAENRTFHSLVARASGNKVLEAFWAAISVLAAGEQHGVRYSPVNRQHVIEAHTGIVRALRARDGASAAARMEAHVSELEHLVRKRGQGSSTRSTRVFAKQG